MVSVVIYQNVCWRLCIIGYWYACIDPFLLDIHCVFVFKLSNDMNQNLRTVLRIFFIISSYNQNVTTLDEGRLPPPESSINSPSIQMSNPHSFFGTSIEYDKLFFVQGYVSNTFT